MDCCFAYSFIAALWSCMCCRLFVCPSRENDVWEDLSNETKRKINHLGIFLIISLVLCPALEKKYCFSAIFYIQKQLFKLHKDIEYDMCVYWRTSLDKYYAHSFMQLIFPNDKQRNDLVFFFLVWHKTWFFLIRS